MNGVHILIFFCFLFGARLVAGCLFDVGLLLVVVELFPLVAEEPAQFTEAGFGVLLLYPLTPVLEEVHVCREGMLGW